MLKKYLKGSICLFILLLLSGCGNPYGEKEDVVTEDAGNAADTLETVEDNPAGEEAESVETSLEETENAQFIYEMNEKFIVNYNEVFAENEVFLKSYDCVEPHVKMPECINREEDIVGEYCEGFPDELQQLLIYHNDSIYNTLPEESDLRRTYMADTERIPDYDPADLPLVVDPPYNVTNYGLIAVDIDSDGEEEFIHERLIDGYEQMTVLEYDDELGWNIIGQGTVEGFNSYVLDYEGKKYIMLRNLLVCRNDAYDGDTSSDSEKPWNVMVVNRELAGYTLNEIYSREEADTDYLSGVDMRNLEDKAERYYCEGWWNNRIGGWNCGDWWLDSIYDWEQEYDGKTYLYVASGFARNGGWPHDVILTVFEEGEGCMETVKIYYFAAHYQLSLENVEYDTDWGDMCN